MRSKATKALLSVSETAAVTGLGERIIRDCAARGEIPSQRFGRLIKIPAWWVQAQLNGPRAEETA